MVKFRVSFAAVLLAVLVGSAVWAQEKKPNVLVIFGDDVGQTNLSAYGFGVVGYMTPNLDRDRTARLDTQRRRAQQRPEIGSTQ